jgi:hypothetical protein
MGLTLAHALDECFMQLKRTRRRRPGAEAPAPARKLPVTHGASNGPNLTVSTISRKT